MKREPLIGGNYCRHHHRNYGADGCSECKKNIKSKMSDLTNEELRELCREYGKALNNWLEEPFAPNTEGELDETRDKLVTAARTALPRSLDEAEHLEKRLALKQTLVEVQKMSIKLYEGKNFALKQKIEEMRGCINLLKNSARIKSDPLLLKLITELFPEEG